MLLLSDRIRRLIAAVTPPQLQKRAAATGFAAVRTDTIRKQYASVNWIEGGVHGRLEPFDVTRFEYITTTNARKAYSNPPDGSGWEELDWYRDDFSEEILWRRIRQGRNDGGSGVLA
jgi:hypothetical protein